MPRPMEAGMHRWRFYRAGGFDQVALRDGSDLVALAELDPKLWVALAMPTRGVELDPRTLELLDGDKDGRVRVPEIVAASAFVKATFRNPDEVVKGGDGLALGSIKDDKVKAAAGRVLAALGKADATVITVADVEEHGKLVDKQRLNGDGVIPPEAATDDETKKLIGEILDTIGGVDDKGGQKGVGKAQIEAFFAGARALVEWHGKADADKSLLVVGHGTQAALDALRAVRAKVDDFFTRCRLAALDPRAAAALNGADADFVALGAKQLSPGDPDVARLPIARVEPGKALPLKDGLNPAWAGAVATLVASAGPLVRGAATQLPEAEWTALKDRLAAYEAWSAAKPSSPVEKLGVERLRAILAGDGEKALAALVAEDEAQKDKNAEVVEVERALRYKRDLCEVLQNFVSFSRFYSRKGAAFQAGTLYLDGRAVTLTLDVTDAGKHAGLAAMSGAYLAYCDLTRPGGEKRQIVAAFTGGDGDNLFVGRNGVFYDRKGRDWDATITKLIPNPISVREGFWAPYKKLASLLEERAAKRGAEGAARSDALVDQAATVGAAPDKAAAPAPKKIDVGTVAAIGVAVGGIGALVVGLLSTFVGMGVWMPLGLLGILLLISGPSMFLAWLKLRKRNLGPLLDANGWAINSRARINVPFGGALTDVAVLPRGAERSMDDPFADTHVPWALYVTLAVVATLGATWYSGKLDGLLPDAVKKSTVFPPAPAPPPPPAPPAG
jgi:hypothetical protein